MPHDCRIHDLEVYEDAIGVLYVRVRKHGGSIFGTKDYRVDYCPVCAHPSKVKIGGHLAVFSRNDVRDDRKDNPNNDSIPNPSFSDAVYRPLSESKEKIVDPIAHFFSQWTDRIQELNTNIEAIKAFMISQNCQNELFMEQEMEIKKRLTKLEKSWTTSET